MAGAWQIGCGPGNGEILAVQIRPHALKITEAATMSGFAPKALWPQCVVFSFSDQAMSDIQVRFATLQDAPAVAALHVSACRAAYAGQVPDAHWDATPMPKRVSFWKEAIEYGEPQVMVAVDGGEIVGFVGFDRSRDPKSKNTTTIITPLKKDFFKTTETPLRAAWLKILPISNHCLQRKICANF